MQIQRYLLVQLATSVVVGVATGLAFYALGLNNAATWGVAAGITNLVPYVGAVIVGVGSAVVGFIQFDSIDKALLIGASSFAIHAVVGNLLTPWWTGRASRMSPFAVFVGVLAVRLAVGRRRPDPRHADPDGREGGLRPRRRAEAGRRVPRRLTRCARSAAGARPRLGRRARRRFRAGPDRARRQTSAPRPATPTISTPQSSQGRSRAWRDCLFGGARRRFVDRERAERGAAEARALAVELRHDGADRQRAGRRIARAGEKAKRRLALRGEDERRERRVDDEPRGDAVERRGALVGNQAQVADGDRQRRSPASCRRRRRARGDRRRRCRPRARADRRARGLAGAPARRACRRRSAGRRRPAATTPPRSKWSARCAAASGARRARGLGDSARR